MVEFPIGPISSCNEAEMLCSGRHGGSATIYHSQTFTDCEMKAYRPIIDEDNEANSILSEEEEEEDYEYEDPALV